MKKENEKVKAQVVVLQEMSLKDDCKTNVAE